MKEVVPLKTNLSRPQRSLHDLGGWSEQKKRQTCDQIFDYEQQKIMRQHT